MLAFWIYKLPRYFVPSFESAGLSVLEKKRKTDFQDGSHNGHLGFPIRMVLPNFDLQVTLILPITFEQIGLSVQEKKSLK